MTNLSYLPKFSDEVTNVEFQLKSKLTKKEILILDFLFEDFNKKQNKVISISYSHLSKKINIESKEEILNLLLSISQKFIEFKIFLESDRVIKGRFYIFNSIVESNETISIVFPEELVNALEKNGFFNKYHLIDLMKLSKINSIIFYKRVLIKLLVEKHLEISVESLKKMFKIDVESYTRFFDFEKYVMDPIFEEIRLIKNINVNYTKIKSGDSKTNKILGLKFELLENDVENVEERVSRLISYIKDEISNFNSIYNYLKKSLVKYDYDYLEKNIVFAKKNPNENFEDFLIKSIENDYSTMEYSSIYGSINLIYDEEKKYGNINEFQNVIYNFMISKNLYYSFNMTFLNVMKSLKIKGNIYFSDGIYRIIGTFNKDSISYIRIYKL